MPGLAVGRLTVLAFLLCSPELRPQKSPNLLVTDEWVVKASFCPIHCRSGVLLGATVLEDTVPCCDQPVLPAACPAACHRLQLVESD